MIGKIKSVMELEKKMEELTAKSKNNSKALKEQSALISEMKKESSDLRKDLAKYLAAAEGHTGLLKDHAGDMGILKKAVEDELYELKLLKQQFQTKLVDELLTSFKEELSKKTSKLDTDVQNYNELKEKLMKVTDDVALVSAEIKKFQEISSGLKSADFELAKYVREVTKVDREKMNLIRENERLQKLISAERRRGRR